MAIKCVTCKDFGGAGCSKCMWKVEYGLIKEHGSVEKAMAKLREGTFDRPVDITKVTKIAEVLWTEHPRDRDLLSKPRVLRP